MGYVLAILIGALLGAAIAALPWLVIAWIDDREDRRHEEIVCGMRRAQSRDPVLDADAACYAMGVPPPYIEGTLAPKAELPLKSVND